ncbi:DUF5994 family protein [Streptomyces sp. BR1]|uniref:DUF5994 family protein n=1 Tax=Streptomyces sp. BR1 TaxID=1592323 RepID=UPI00402B9D27
MSATILPFPAQRDPAATPPVRLALKPPGTTRGLLDGAWWPRSRDLLSELPVLTGVLDPLWGRITRVAVNPEHWPVMPRKVPVGGHVVKVGGFTQQDPHKLLLLSYGVGRWDLLVIPPGTTAAAAARLMAAATDGTGPQPTASALVAAEASRHDPPAADRPQDPEEAWEYEGGASSTHVGAAARPSRLLVGM